MPPLPPTIGRFGGAIGDCRATLGLRYHPLKRPHGLHRRAEDATKSIGLSSRGLTNVYGCCTIDGMNERNRTEMVGVRLSPSERKRLEKCAKKDHRALAAWVRMVALEAATAGQRRTDGQP